MNLSGTPRTPQRIPKVFLPLSLMTSSFAAIGYGQKPGKKLYDETKATYDQQMNPRYGAARLWLDAIIDPLDTRDAITAALSAASLNPEVPKFSVGVLQT